MKLRPPMLELGGGTHRHLELRLELFKAVISQVPITVSLDPPRPTSGGFRCRVRTDALNPSETAAVHWLVIRLTAMDLTELNRTLNLR